MREKEIIAKIKELKQIKPRKEWVVFTYQKIFNEELQKEKGFVKNLEIIFSHKYAFACLVAIAVIIGTFGFAQNSLPGDTLFSLKKITEKGQAVFVSPRYESKYNLELASRRLSELTQIAEKNMVRNLKPAIDEYQTSVSQAAKSLKKTKLQNKEEMREIIGEVKEIEKKREKIKALGVEIGEDDKLNSALAGLVEREIKELKERSLTQEQEKILVEAEKSFEEGNYSQALEKILYLSQ